MSNDCIKGIFILFLLQLSTTAFCQNGSLKKSGRFPQTDSLKKIDSANAEILQQYNLKLKEIELQRTQDSVKKVELVSQLNSLRTTDNFKKEELQNQLEQLHEKEIIRSDEKKARIDSLKKTAQSFAVIGFFKDTLFSIYSRLGSFSAQERAEAITGRINKLAERYPFSADSLKVAEAETTSDIVFGETIIMSVSENDALWNNISKIDLAENYRQIIGAAVIKYKHETSFINLSKEVGLALLVIIILAVIIFYCNRLFKWVANKIHQQEGKRITGIRIKSYTLFDVQRQVRVLIFLNSILKWLIILLLVYIALPILFGIFPWTKNFAGTLFGFILTPVKKIAFALWNYLPNMFTIIVILIVFRYILKGIYYLKTEVEKGKLAITGFYPDWANPTYQIIRLLLFAFMFIVIFPYLPGSDSPVFKGVSVFLGVLFTFGSSGSLSNVIAGLVLTYMRAFKIGDRVKIGEITGDIIEKSLLVTRVRTIKNEIISIPNSNVMSSHTINYSSDALDNGLIMHTTVTIGYDVPWKNMHAALIDAALRTEGLLKEPAPFVLQTSLDDFYVSYQVNSYTKEPNKQAVIYSQLHQNIQDCCNEAGIEILSPHYRASRDGNATTIPANYLSKDYKAPGFNMNIHKGHE